MDAKAQAGSSCKADLFFERTQITFDKFLEIVFGESKDTVYVH
jgi:hypothetical protein